MNDFEFSFQPSIDEKRIKGLFSFSFVERKENVIFLGPPGVGKTHLAIALGFEALKHGMSCYFASSYDLFLSLSKAYHEGKFEQRIRAYTSPKILIPR